MRFGDLRRLALDIEVVTGEGYEFPQRARERPIASWPSRWPTPRASATCVRGDRLDEAALLEERTAGSSPSAIPT